MRQAVCTAALRLLGGRQDDAAEAEWHDVAAPPQPLAFDHKEIIRAAFQRLLGHPQAQTGDHPMLQLLHSDACLVLQHHWAAWMCSWHGIICSCA